MQQRAPSPRVATLSRNGGQQDHVLAHRIIGATNGGFHQKPSDPVAQAPSIVIAVNDVREAMQKITAAGRTLLTDPMEIPGVGQYVSFRDTEGNRASILQPSPRSWPSSPQT
jgi:predicted enzyme related to lactoylglutathione lyase